MGYQLTITAGLGEGKSFSFDQAETKIGRTSDNDVVLFDPGVSRRHARIVEKDGAFFAEDLGSANGTRVNGEMLSQARKLTTGDAITVGPVVFAFQLVNPFDDLANETTDQAVAGQETRIVGRNTVLPRDRTVTEDELMVQSERATTALPSMPKSGPSKVPARASTAAVAAPAPAAAPASKAGPLSNLSAAERARLRREAGESVGGQIRYTWMQMSLRARIIAVAVALLLLLGGAGAVVSVYAPDLGKGGPTGPEPARLSLKPIEDSFGFGDGVTWERADLKAFSFEFTTPTRAVVVLHYRAADVSEQEVSITVNGQDQGYVPGDAGAINERELELVLPHASLKRNERNELIFDNLHNPPAEDPWRIEGLWIEVVPIPELSNEETIRSAQEYARKAGEFFDQREVGSENLFRAWKNYRYAWLSLEALDGQRPELYETVRFQMNAIKRELDQQCSRLMLAAQKSMQLKQRQKARQTLEEVPLYFPTNEHRCHNLAQQKLIEYDL